MVIYDDIITWPGLNQDILNESECRIRIIKLDTTGPVAFLKKYYIIASDIGVGSGISITNGAQFLIPFVCRTHEISMDTMVWFEHYPHKKDPTLDVLTPKLIQACCPSGCSGKNSVVIEWRPARKNEIEHLKQFIPDIEASMPGSDSFKGKEQKLF